MMSITNHPILGDIASFFNAQAIVIGRTLSIPREYLRVSSDLANEMIYLHIADKQLWLTDKYELENKTVTTKVLIARIKRLLETYAKSLKGVEDPSLAVDFSLDELEKAKAMIEELSK